MCDGLHRGGWSSIPRKQANRRGWYKHWKESVMVGLPGSVVSPRWYPKSQDQSRHQITLGFASVHSNYGRTWQMVGVSWRFFLYMPFATQPWSDWVRAPRQCMYNIYIYICIENTRMIQVVRSFFKKELHRLVVAIAAQTWILLLQLAILQMLW
jgi:hypothetical protein